MKNIGDYFIYTLGRVIQGSVKADAYYLKMLYKHKMRTRLNLEKPELFNEKMQWLKLYNRQAEYTTMVDKYAVKKYVAEKLGQEYVIPVLGVWDRFEDIDFDKLPNQFVLKCTHDSGGLIICKDKDRLNRKEAKRIISHCLKRNYFSNTREWPYKDVPPRIIAEEYLENSEEGLHDYKIWCFDGKPKYIQYITGRIGNETYEGFYDYDWKFQEFNYHNPLIKKTIPAPKCKDKLFELAGKLAKDIPFVRCDFYVLKDGTIRFGEITFYPMSGMEKWTPERVNQDFGEMITLDY